jgi:hypothetical protein
MNVVVYGALKEEEMVGVMGQISKFKRRADVCRKVRWRRQLSG